MDRKKDVYELPENLKRKSGISVARILLILFLLFLALVVISRFPLALSLGVLALICVVVPILILVLAVIFILSLGGKLVPNADLKAWIENNVRCPYCGNKVRTTSWPSYISSERSYNPCGVQCVSCGRESVFYIGPSTVEPLGPSNAAPAILGRSGSFILSKLGVNFIEDPKKAIAIYLIIIFIVVFIIIGIVGLFIIPALSHR